MRLIFFIALRQLWARKLLNGIAVGGVMLGVTTLIAMNGIMNGFQHKFLSEMLRISPHIAIYDKELVNQRLVEDFAAGPVVATVAHEQPSDRTTRIKRPRDIMRVIEAMPGVLAACNSLVGQAIVSLVNKDLGVDMRGVIPREQDRCTPVSQYMENASWHLLGVTANGVVLGSGVAEDLGAHVGDHVRIVAPGGVPQSLKVVDIFESAIPVIDNTRIFVNLTTAQAVLRRPDAIGRIEVRLADPDAARSVTERLERIVHHDTESWQEANANFLQLFQMQKMIIGFVITAILTVGGFGILAIQVMIVLQKTRDIAIMRAVGLRRADILWVFLIQGVIVALVGAAFGDLAGWRILQFLASLDVTTEALVKATKFLVHEDPIYYVYGIVFAVVTGTLASLLPSFRGSRVEPVDVLRGQIG